MHPFTFSTADKLIDNSDFFLIIHTYLEKRTQRANVVSLLSPYRETESELLFYEK